MFGIIHGEMVSRESSYPSPDLTLPHVHVLGDMHGFDSPGRRGLHLYRELCNLAVPDLKWEGQGEAWRWAAWLRNWRARQTRLCIQEAAQRERIYCGSADRGADKGGEMEWRVGGMLMR